MFEVDVCPPDCHRSTVIRCGADTQTHLHSGQRINAKDDLKIHQCDSEEKN